MRSSLLSIVLSCLLTTAFAQFCEEGVKGSHSAHLEQIKIDETEHNINFEAPYMNLSDLEFELEAGESYSIILEGHSLALTTNSQVIWVDWNNNQEFEDSEKIEHPDNPEAILMGYTRLNLNVPKNLSCGSRRMRVMLHYQDKENETNPEACAVSNPEKGIGVEVRDLTLKVKGNCKDAIEAFTVVDKQGDIYLNWRMFKNSNLSTSFTIERSENAVDFEALETLKGNNTRLLEYIDKEKDFSDLCFYRIKFETRSGEIQYSSVKGVLVKDRMPELIFFPNPVPQGNSIRLETKGENILIQTIRIFNINGTIVHESNEEGQRELQVNTANLSPGLYFLEVNRKLIYKMEVIYYRGDKI